MLVTAKENIEKTLLMCRINVVKFIHRHPTEKVGWLFLCKKIISKKFLLSGTFCVSDLGVSMEGHYNMLVPPQLR